MAGWNGFRGLAGVLALALASVASGCEADVKGAGMDTDEPVDSDTDAMPETDASSDGSAGMDTRGPPQSCTSTCDAPPGDCFADAGECIDGTCNYAPVLAGESCTDDCPAGGFCDAAGQCICAAGGCEDTCVAGEHATATCDESGECIRECEPPYENCDGDWSNGCEIPVGVPGVCDAAGINLESGCWTAWCGASDAPEATNFGTFYCSDCSTCREDGGQCQWCNHDTGQWYPAEACTCDPEYHDVACGA